MGSYKRTRNKVQPLPAASEPEFIMNFMKDRIVMICALPLVFETVLLLLICFLVADSPGYRTHETLISTLVLLAGMAIQLLGLYLTSSDHELSYIFNLTLFPCLILWLRVIYEYGIQPTFSIERQLEYEQSQDMGSMAGTYCI